MPPHHLLLVVEEVHRAPLAFRASGLLPKQFRHALLGRHAHCQPHAVIPVGGNYRVLPEPNGVDAPGRDGFLSDVEVQKARDLLLLVHLSAAILKAALQQHATEQVDHLFVLDPQVLVPDLVGRIRVEGNRLFKRSFRNVDGLLSPRPLRFVGGPVARERTGLLLSRGGLIRRAVGLCLIIRVSHVSRPGQLWKSSEPQRKTGIPSLPSRPAGLGRPSRQY